MTRRQISIFSTCPQSKAVSAEHYTRAVRDVARWSEEAGCRGILVYADNGLVDPWLVAQQIMQCTTVLSPLVAVQPVYLHPYAAAKMVASMGHMFGRQMFLNMIAGGFRNDLIALNDDTPHDDRYVRLTEYTQIISRLLASDDPLTYEGKYYTVRNLRLTPSLPEDLMPGILMSGSSPAGLAAAKTSNAVAVKYPQRPSDEAQLKRDPELAVGMRVGIVARESTEEAWQAALERFPVDRKGQIMHKLAMNVSDSHWHRQLSEMAAESAEKDDPYWLGPFENYRTFCPYLVGSYDRVATELQRYIEIGHDTFILDIPPCQEELMHIQIVFRQAMQNALAELRTT